MVSAASATWSSSRAADLVGVLSMRDIVRCWTEDGATVGPSVPDGARPRLRSGSRTPLAQWWSSGSSLISRAAARIQMTVAQEQDRGSDHEPDAEVMETMTPASPIALSSGSRLARRHVDVLAGRACLRLAGVRLGHAV